MYTINVLIKSKKYYQVFIMLIFVHKIKINKDVFCKVKIALNKKYSFNYEYVKII